MDMKCCRKDCKEIRDSTKTLSCPCATFEPKIKNTCVQKLSYIVCGKFLEQAEISCCWRWKNAAVSPYLIDKALCMPYFQNKETEPGREQNYHYLSCGWLCVYRGTCIPCVLP